MARTIAIMAAEPSGDLQGGALASALLQRDPDLSLIGIGCSAMARAGVKLMMDSSVWSTIGPAEALARLPALYLAYRKMRHMLVRARPDLTVVIDAPALHMRLAGYLARKSLRTLYYFPPSAWSPNPERARQITQRVDAVVGAFRFTYRTYCENGLRMAYYGHPLVDLVARGSPGQAARQLGLPEGRYVALLPGSRTQEVRLLLPVALEVARRLRGRYPDVEFLLPAASLSIEKKIRRRAGKLPDWVRVFPGRSREVLAASRLALMASGSATLEAAILGVPMVVFYKMNTFDYNLGQFLIARGLLKVPRFVLPNLVLQEDILPELLQNDANPDRVEREAVRLFEEGPERSRMVEALDRVRAALDGPDVVPRIAAFVDHFSRSRDFDRAHAAVERERGAPCGSRAV
ncbi:MAG: lipid-A-disaccharide synthase [Armatimonadetes bacterium]|nr:lipid-A-disaccharide synthase [Armatimonadota bacterium]